MPVTNSLRAITLTIAWTGLLAYVAAMPQPPSASPTQMASSTTATPTRARYQLPSPSASPMACAGSILLSSLVEDSYEKHVELIRQGIPMELVKTFYEQSLKEVSSNACVCEQYYGEVDSSCVNRLFIDDYGLVSARLAAVVSEDGSRPIASRIFPHLVLPYELPPMHELEYKAVTEGREGTLVDLDDIGEAHWRGVTFPTDELLRVDPKKDRACEEFDQKMNENSLWLPATALTAYVMGIAEQILLLPDYESAAESILGEHVRMVHQAGRCTRQTGDDLRVPAIFVESFVTRALLTLKNCSTITSAALIAGLPSISFVYDLVYSSRKLFPEAIRQMSSLNSFGRTKYLSWNSTDVFLQPLIDVMRANATLQRYTNIFSNGSIAAPAGPLLCSAGFLKTARLTEVTEERAQCCSHRCIQTSGAAIKLSVMNEMCCWACNEAACNVDELAHVTQTLAFGFDREPQSAVANVW